MKKFLSVMLLLTAGFVVFAQKQIGSWQDKEFTTTWQQKEWDFSSFADARGKYSISFAYTKGAHKLCMKDVVVLADGKPVFASSDEVSAGYSARSFSFEFCLRFRRQRQPLFQRQFHCYNHFRTWRDASPSGSYRGYYSGET